MRGLVSYIRVSTSKQGKSGLAIEAHREALARFACSRYIFILGIIFQCKCIGARMGLMVEKHEP